MHGKGRRGQAARHRYRAVLVCQRQAQYVPGRHRQGHVARRGAHPVVHAAGHGRVQGRFAAPCGLDKRLHRAGVGPAQAGVTPYRPALAQGARGRGCSRAVHPPAGEAAHLGRRVRQHGNVHRLFRIQPPAVRHPEHKGHRAGTAQQPRLQGGACPRVPAPANAVPRHRGPVLRRRPGDPGRAAALALYIHASAHAGIGGSAHGEQRRAAGREGGRSAGRYRHRQGRRHRAHIDARGIGNQRHPRRAGPRRGNLIQPCHGHVHRLGRHPRRHVPGLGLRAEFQPHLVGKRRVIGPDAGRHASARFHAGGRERQGRGGVYPFHRDGHIAAARNLRTHSAAQQGDMGQAGIIVPGDQRAGALPVGAYRPKAAQGGTVRRLDGDGVPHRIAQGAGQGGACHPIPRRRKAPAFRQIVTGVRAVGDQALIAHHHTG